MKILILVFCFCFCTSKTEKLPLEKFNKLTAQITQCHADKGYGSDEDFQKIRIGLYEKGKLDFLNNTDTIYIIEGFNDQLEYVSKIWTTQNEGIECLYQNGEFYFSTDRRKFLPDYMCMLVERWDTVQLQTQPKENIIIFGGLSLFATRIIKYKNSDITDCVSFEQFKTPEEYKKR